ncbi:MAG: hypothetical protein U0414_18635 [Polyangiaceae bacterium]
MSGKGFVSRRSRGGLLGAGAPLLVAMALGVSAFGGTACEVAGTGDEQDVAETKNLFGDDRVADKLKGHLDKVPRNWAEFEKLFGVGRQCARTDSKEIFVVEESTTRATGEQIETGQLLPRAVITGCNTGVGNPDDEPSYMSYSLMAALFSSPDVPNAPKGDPMVFDRVEVMALDRKTGLYNFYVMTPSADPKKAGTLMRVQLRPDGKIYTYTKDPAKTKTVTKVSEDRMCNNCHVNMGPLMNEMHEPWTNWVSTHKTLPETASKLTGETASIVSEAIAFDGSHSRSSLANDLEKTMTAALRVWNEGASTAPNTGFISENLSGDQPQGVGGLLKSVFCQTELQYASTSSLVPIELFVDPGAVAGGKFIAPPAYSSELFPILMPIRSDMDKRIETAFIKKQILKQNTVIAIRLVDDKNDIFSTKRCSLYDPIVAGLPTDTAQIDAFIRNSLKTQATTLYKAASTKAYADLLLQDAPAADALKAARVKYLGDMTTAYTTDTAKLKTVKGRDELKTRSQTRKDQARIMFDRDANPMPVLHDEKKGI